MRKFSSKEKYTYLREIILAGTAEKQQDLQDRKRHDIQDILFIMPLAILQILLLSES